MTDDEAKARGSGTGESPEHTRGPEGTGAFAPPPDETGESPDAGTADMDAWTRETEKRNPAPASGQE